jgi:hypothetical protein
LIWFKTSPAPAVGFAGRKLVDAQHVGQHVRICWRDIVPGLSSGIVARALDHLAQAGAVEIRHEARTGERRRRAVALERLAVQSSKRRRDLPAAFGLRLGAHHPRPTGRHAVLRAQRLRAAMVS